MDLLDSYNCCKNLFTHTLLKYSHINNLTYIPYINIACNSTYILVGSQFTCWCGWLTWALELKFWVDSDDIVSFFVFRHFPPSLIICFLRAIWPSWPGLIISISLLVVESEFAFHLTWISCSLGQKNRQIHVGMPMWLTLS